MISFREIANCREICDVPVHGKDAVGSHHSEAGIAGLPKLNLEVFHVVVEIAKALRFREANAIDDAGMIQFVRDDHIFCAQQSFEQTAIRIETGAVKDRVLSAEKFT